jgi:hypothetical protein
MTRKDNKIEMSIIGDMDMSLCTSERKFLKRIYTDKPPKKSRNIQEIMDGLILMVHERNWLEKTREGKWSEEDRVKMEFLNGEINALCYVLGYDTRL